MNSNKQEPNSTDTASTADTTTDHVPRIEGEIGDWTLRTAASGRVYAAYTTVELFIVPEPNGAQIDTTTVEIKYTVEDGAATVANLRPRHTDRFEPWFLAAIPVANRELREAFSFVDTTPALPELANAINRQDLEPTDPPGDVFANEDAPDPIIGNNEVDGDDEDLVTDGGQPIPRNLPRYEIVVNQVAVRNGHDITTEWRAELLDEDDDARAGGGTAAEAVDTLIRHLQEEDDQDLVTDGGTDQRPPYLAPSVDAVECYGCNEYVRVENTVGIDISPPDEYYPRMRSLCPDCADFVQEEEQAVTDGGQDEAVEVDRVVLEELVTVAKGKLERDYQQYDPDGAFYDLDEFADTIKTAEKALAGDGGGPTFTHEEPCDWTDEALDGDSCGDTPTAHVGDIYYACEEHFDAFRDWLDHGDDRKAVTDGGVETVPTEDGPDTGLLRTAYALSTFQRDLLVELLAEGPTHGLGLKARIDEQYGRDTNHSQLYPNLDALADNGLVEKGSVDQRTNEYEVTQWGRDVIAAYADHLMTVINGGAP